MYQMLRTMRHQRDSGSALVSAVAVAIIGIALTTVVVTQAIIVTQDAARDRLRTAEIHSAEGALDASLNELETTLPCGTPSSPSFSPITVGSGASAVEVSVVIEYFDASGPLTDCTVTGTLADVPSRAVVTAVAVPVEQRAGIQPERTIQASVRLIPNQAVSFGSAIFSGSELEGTNNGTIRPVDPEKPAGIWIDEGDFECNSGYFIDGSLVVPDGGAYLTNSCRVEGFVWAEDFVTVTSVLGGYRVQEDVTVEEGNFTVTNPNNFGGSIFVGGDVGGAGFSTARVEGTVCAENSPFTPCGPLPAFESQGFPEVTYEFADWTGFVEKPVSGAVSWTEDVIDGWNLSSSWQTNFRAQPCSFGSWMSPAPVHLTDVATVYDLRGCSFQAHNRVTFEIYADTVIFADNVVTSGQFSFNSGDDEPHELWFIVPSNGTEVDPATISNQCQPTTTYPGCMTFSNQTTIDPQLALFLYTPGYIHISNNTTLYGQIYGRKTGISSNFTLNYVGMGIPGVDLGGADSIPGDGMTVIVDSKHELRN